MIKVLKKALSILEYMGKEPQRPYALSEIAGHLNLNLATCSHIIKTLVESCYIERLPLRKGYIIGPMVYQFSKTGSYRGRLVETAGPFMTQFVKELQETIIISVLVHGKRFMPYFVQGNRPVQINADLFFHEDIYETATGRLLLAYLPSEELEFTLGVNGDFKHSWVEASTKERLYALLEQIRKKGSAFVSSQESVAMAFPIMENNTVIAALGVPIPRSRFKGDHKRELLSRLETISRQISSRLSVSAQYI